MAKTRTEADGAIDEMLDKSKKQHVKRTAKPFDMAAMSRGKKKAPKNKPEFVQYLIRMPKDMRQALEEGSNKFQDVNGRSMPVNRIVLTALMQFMSMNPDMFEYEPTRNDLRYIAETLKLDPELIGSWFQMGPEEVARKLGVTVGQMREKYGRDDDFDLEEIDEDEDVEEDGEE